MKLELSTDLIPIVGQLNIRNRNPTKSIFFSISFIFIPFLSLTQNKALANDIPQGASNAGTTGIIRVGNGSFAIGEDATVGGDNSIAIGYNASAYTSYFYHNKTAIGANSSASVSGSTALGSGTLASYSYSTAIGYGATTDKINQIVLGRSDDVVTIKGMA